MIKIKLSGSLQVLLLVCLAETTWGACSPIVIDMGNDGIYLGDKGVGVYFDVNADGSLEHVQWVRPGGDEVFLVLDRNGNGIVDDGSELFGVGTPMILDGGTAVNGFVALAQYDRIELGGNDDGLILPADRVWSQLLVWHDENADGVSIQSEMSTLASTVPSLVWLETIPKKRKYFDHAGNSIPYRAWAGVGGNTRKNRILMVDVFFAEL